VKVIQLTALTYAELRAKLRGAGLGHLITGFATGEVINLGRVHVAMDPSPPVKEIPIESAPLVLYFKDAAERADFVLVIREAKPGMAEMVVP
jgi:hypothetical protein